MQTFITDQNLVQSAKNLDVKRLGKQRVEALQIVSTLLGYSQGWKNHPAVKMWKGYEDFLLMRYIPSIFNRWESKGYLNGKCHERWFHMISENPSRCCISNSLPLWITNEFILSHRSNLIRKFPEHYQPLWPDVPNDLPYVWPS